MLKIDGYCLTPHFKSRLCIFTPKVHRSTPEQSYFRALQHRWLLINNKFQLPMAGFPFYRRVDWGNASKLLSQGNYNMHKLLWMRSNPQPLDHKSDALTTVPRCLNPNNANQLWIGLKTVAWNFDSAFPTTPTTNIKKKTPVQIEHQGCGTTVLLSVLTWNDCPWYHTSQTLLQLCQIKTMETKTYCDFATDRLNAKSWQVDSLWHTVRTPSTDEEPLQLSPKVVICNAEWTLT